jgi:gluconate 2-dehydrogenase gamma chain
MDRRKVLKLLASAAALPAVHSDFYSVLHSIHASLPAATHKTFSAHQHATVAAMADMIIPQTETPGAVDAGVPEFIDLILSDWSEEHERSRFLDGLAAVDKLSRLHFGKDFADASADERKEILRLLGEEMAREQRRLASGPRGARGETPEPHGNFYFTFRQMVLTGYFTSEKGATQQLHYAVIPDHIDPCAPLAGDKTLAATNVRSAK